MLSNAYFLAKFRFDTAENEPAKNLQNFAKFANFADPNQLLQSIHMSHRGAPSRGDLDGVRFGLALQQLSVFRVVDGNERPVVVGSCFEIEAHRGGCIDLAFTNELEQEQKGRE